MRIAVCGSTGMDDEAVLHAAERLGTEIGVRGHEVAFGLYAGLPYRVASAAKRAGSRVVGYAPYPEEFTSRWLLAHDPDPDGILDETIHLPPALALRGQTQVKIRNIMLVGSAQAAAVLAGAWGTVTEFGMARSIGIPVGLLRHTGGAADALVPFVRAVEGGGGEPEGLVYTDDPAAMVEELQRLVEAAMRSHGPREP